MDLLDIKMLNTAIERTLNRELARFGLTFTQASIIAFLATHDDRDVHQNDIEHAFGLTHPTVSSILRRLEAKQLTVSVPLPQDRRYRSIRLTERSRTLYRRIDEAVKGISASIFTGILRSDEDSFDRTLQTMLTNMAD